MAVAGIRNRYNLLSAKGAINKKGNLKTWGTNQFGDLGDNSTSFQSTPVAVAGALKTFCKISSSDYHSLTIDKNGRVWSWGYNNLGQLGDNTLISKLTPVAIGGALKTFCEINVGIYSSFAITRLGRLWAWGYNQSGCLGDNTTIVRSTPVSVLGAVKTFCKVVSTGAPNTGAIDKNGRIWTWGANSFGQLGDNTVISKLTPVAIAGALKTFCKITGGAYFFCAIDKNGRVWSWGNNGNGQLGNNTTTSRSTPVAIAGALKTFCEITGSLNAFYTLAIDKNGRIWGWGTNSLGQLGDNTVIGKSTPVAIAGTLKTFCKIAAGNPGGSYSVSLAIDKNNKVWGWGSTFLMGIGVGIYYTTPLTIKGATKTFCQISGSDSTLAIDKNGRLWGWGNNLRGEIGDNTIISKKTPVSILGAVKTFCKISVSSYFSTAIDKNGRVWSWGNNVAGQLGDNTVISKSTPVAIAGALKTFCEITNLYINDIFTSEIPFTLAIDKNGRIWGWGGNGQGQLGQNNTTNKSTPVAIAGALKTFCKINAGGLNGGFSSSASSLAIDKNGRIWGWGNNNEGQLGQNNTTNRSTPVAIAGALKTFCKIASVFNSSMAIDKNGRIWCWGNNGIGQLGDNTMTNKSTPVAIAGALKTFCEIAISSGASQSALAIDKNGRIWGWGNNGNGELGDNTTTCRSTPVAIAGALKTFCQVGRTSTFTSFAIDKNGRVWTWGMNVNTLGLNQEFRVLTPVLISYL